MVFGSKVASYWLLVCSIVLGQNTVQWLYLISTSSSNYFPLNEL